MKVLDKFKILDFMSKRKEALYSQVTRDFAGGLEGRLFAHNELKFWKEAIERGEFDVEVGNIERGEFDTELSEVYVILSATSPEIADFTFYDDEESAKNRVEELNKFAKKQEYWYITLYSNVRNGE